MSQSTPFASTDSLEGRRTDAGQIAAHSYSYDDLLRHGWPPIARGIILAGGAYPIVLGAGYVGIGHLLWIAVWFGLLLTVIRLSGIPYRFVLPLIAGWSVYQAATLWMGWLLARRFGPW